jgi:hypothetical protein
MNVKVLFAIFSLCCSTIPYQIDAQPFSLLSHIKMLIDASKIAENAVDPLGDYPPIFVEQFLAYFGKETSLPRRSYDLLLISHDQRIFLMS